MQASFTSLPKDVDIVMGLDSGLTRVGLTRRETTINGTDIRFDIQRRNTTEAYLSVYPSLALRRRIRLEELEDYTSNQEIVSNIEIEDFKDIRCIPLCEERDLIRLNDWGGKFEDLSDSGETLLIELVLRSKSYNNEQSRYRDKYPAHCEFIK